MARMIDQVKFSQRHPWSRREVSGWTVYSAGDLDPDALVTRALTCRGAPSSESVGQWVTSLSGCFAFLAQNDRYVVAACDRVRGYPVFYARGKHEKIQFSNSARTLEKSAHLVRPDHVSLLEFLMAGYVTGSNTVYQELFQVQAGEILIFKKSSAELQTSRFYEFIPKDTEESEVVLIESLAAATERAFQQVIERANGRPVLVPLSGGLDSRLVIAMLKALGCPSLHAFSYGPPGNVEAKRAAIVAAKLDVPWTFYPSKRESARKLFSSQIRKDYWAASDGLCSVPNMQEFQVFAELVQGKSIPPEAVVVNGQAGDFITGGHVTSLLTDATANADVLFQAVVDKHFSLWESMRTETNLSQIRDRFDTTLAPAMRLGQANAAVLFEYWEWRERQSKYVANQQRVYDFFELEWALPLWSKEYCDFWKKVPLELRIDQRLYRKYLEEWDYGGVFTDRRLKRRISHWPGITKMVIPLARVVGLVAGSRGKELVYRYLKYFGHYSNQYGAYSYPYFLRRARDMRNNVSFYAETWLRDHFPVWMNAHFSLD